MARQTNVQKQINRTTGVSRQTSGTATRHANRMKRQIRNSARRKSNGGSGG